MAIALQASNFQSYKSGIFLDATTFEILADNPPLVRTDSIGLIGSHKRDEVASYRLRACSRGAGE